MHTRTTHPAAFHDIGKLIDWKAVGLQAYDESGRPTESEPHDFEKCVGPEWGVRFAAVPWEAIHRKQETLRATHWPSSSVGTWTSLADQLAAGWGRAISETLLTSDPIFGRYCLWTGALCADPRLKEPQALHDMIAFLNTAPSWNQAEEKYGIRWQQRAKTARPGLNVTSLHAHSVVTEKLARVLATLPAESFAPGASWQQIQQALDRLKLTVAHFRIHVDQRPFRVGEWNIFAQRREAMEAAIQRFADYIIGRSENECVGVFSSLTQAEAFVQAVTSAGFGVTRRQEEKPISEIKAHGILGILPSRWQRVYPGSLPARISLPICEACQMAHAEYRWPANHLALRSDLREESRRLLREMVWPELRLDDFPDVDRPKLLSWLGEWGEEDLCTSCFGLRRNAGRLTKLARWSGYMVAWVHVSLDLQDLRNSLGRLQRDYIRACDPNTDQQLLERVEANFPLIADFLSDFEQFLVELSQGIGERFGADRIEQVDNNLWCVRLDARSDALHLLDLYNRGMQHHFPKLCATRGDRPCAVRVSLSVSPHKHPFFVHWRFIEKARSDVAVQLVGSGTATLAASTLPEVLRALDHGKRGALHRLRDIARTSPALAEVVLRDRQDRDRMAYEKLQQLLPQKLDFQGLLTLSNLARD
jgi:hypothetical protein